MKKINIFHEFVLINFFTILVIVVVFSYSISNLLISNMLKREGRITTDIVRVITRVDLNEEKFKKALRLKKIEVFQVFFERLKSIPEFIRLKVYDEGGTIVWSDEARAIGKNFKDNKELKSSLAGNIEVKMGLIKKEHIYEIEKVPERRLLEIYVPLLSEDKKRIYSVMEVYKYPVSLFKSIDSAKRFIWLLAASVGLVLFLSLSWLFRKAMKKEIKLNEELLESKKFIEDIIENMNTGIFVIDRDLKILSWNKAMENITKKELPKETVIGKKFLEVFPILETIGFEKKLKDIFSTKKPLILYDQEYPVSGGSEVLSLNIRVIPLLGSNVEVSNLIITFTDLSEMKKLREQLIQTEKLSTMGSMYAGLTHEINNPLGIIVSKVRMILSHNKVKKLSEDVIDDLEIIKKHSMRITEIIRNLLAFARRSSFKSIPLDINEVLLDAIQLAEKPFAKMNIKIEKELKRDLPSIFADSNQLQQVFLNLFTNARDAMLEGGIIKVKTCLKENDASLVVVLISDTGAGISQENIKKIWEPFFTTKDTGKGTGLGLSVSYGIIKGFGGDIEVESKLGQGTTFKIVLPSNQDGSTA
ncbi:MAG: hypothetical protein A3C43_09690 [Candidatus Schekmanbacteria bacterium RIFCSPHIGHO2_02_FULL_38_11]|uniref:histidine kinase n=1 Tax=Candidatus Schekmanbacteria bacterium RIFCSPLOWO2_12_FULL_38_15 TaxID=1817883 RepID=A0A1F7SDJ4_9BACT|nr:MAG: hypothetical protein A3C43_09690 [Candidatus Schekmanbacteria bacterium RIFCSPHIGHO2_02_FULL_38_11]OGL51495.1 MAG: hypothetical protein A3H37_12345 [Candidatus Schekmanbacteria bacterium RIFCSPLOWO2_02_FULL_38_14]OGL51845.1 MAG: hypothetical protein A3G31_12750 [Candidatus Schekmanbacteria bacterium RIFCSPLOWO2_12_FULL_38_15]